MCAYTDNVRTVFNSTKLAWPRKHTLNPADGKNHTIMYAHKTHMGKKGGCFCDNLTTLCHQGQQTFTNIYAVVRNQQQKLKMPMTFSWQPQFPQNFTPRSRGKYHLHSQPPSFTHCFCARLLKNHKQTVQ